jgi:hypothetical protein
MMANFQTNNTSLYFAFTPSSYVNMAESERVNVAMPVDRPWPLRTNGDDSFT